MDDVEELLLIVCLCMYVCSLLGNELFVLNGEEEENWKPLKKPTSFWKCF